MIDRFLQSHTLHVSDSDEDTEVEEEETPQRRKKSKLSNSSEPGIDSATPEVKTVSIQGFKNMREGSGCMKTLHFNLFLV